MTVSLRDARASADDRRWIQATYPEYLEELAEISHSGTGVFPIFGEHGPRDSELLARWFRDDRSHPIVILDSGGPAGFALVSRPLVPARPPVGARPADGTDYRLAEFYVRRAHRRRGIGRAAAALIFSRFAGRWEVSEAMGNTEAVAFWRRVIMAYTRGRYDERVADGEVRQRFSSVDLPR
ncbi:MAG: GNAT family N-acetyltransferase [Steroidobacteraceae bacterium]|jgi:predicted acetyltransferase|nr:GNAT family N-acetyltransferase [Steroidobacteraceae bacterium]